MSIKVAAVQMVSNNGDCAGNRSKPEEYITDAGSKDAKLILLPEFTLAGYLYADDFWGMAERFVREVRGLHWDPHPGKRSKGLL